MDAADKLHIGHILHKMPGQLSGGRTAARGHRPRPGARPGRLSDGRPDLGAGRAPARGNAGSSLKRIQREAGRTLIYVTHDQEEGDVGRRSHGHSGKRRHSPDRHARLRFMTNPATTYVARFLGSPGDQHSAGIRRMGVTVIEAASVRCAWIVPARDRSWRVWPNWACAPKTCA